MGKQMSKFKFVTRPIKNYNVEDRAFKVISRDKPSAAPPYPSMKQVMQDIKNDPELLTKDKLSEEHKEHLSRIHVVSTGVNPTVERKVKDLPHDRHTHEDPLYGYHEPIKIPVGKLTLRQILELLDKHEIDSVKNSPEVLAFEYKLKPEVTRAIITYFRPFKVHLPSKAGEEETTRLGEVKRLMIKPFHLDIKQKKDPRDS